MDPVPRFSIVLPVRNQGDHIAAVVRRYLKSLSGASCEILLMVNGSSDDSAGVCARAAREYPGVRYFHDPVAGWGRAVRSGLAAASGEFLCYTNSARTLPEELPRFFEALVASPGAIVKGHRVRRMQGLFRTAGSAIYNFENRLLHGVESNDVNGTPKLMARSTFDLLALTDEGDLLDLELLRQCREKGIPIVELPIEESARHGGISTTTWSSAVRLLLGSLALWKRSRRCLT